MASSNLPDRVGQESSLLPLTYAAGEVAALTNELSSHL